MRGLPIGEMSLIVAVASGGSAMRWVSSRTSGGTSHLTGVGSKECAASFEGVTAVDAMSGFTGGPSGFSPVGRLETGSVGFTSDGGLIFFFLSSAG